MLQLEFSLAKEEFQEFVYYANWLSPDQSGYRTKTYLNSFAWILVMFFIILLFGAISNLSALGVFALIFFVLFFLISALTTKGNYYRVASQLLSEDNGEQVILGNKTVTFFDENISISTDFSETKYKWNAIVKKIEHKDCFYLYVGPREAIIIPSRVLRLPGNELLFKKYLSEHLSIPADFPGH